VRQAIRDQLAASLPPILVDELLEAHEEAKRNYYLGGDRLAAVEGGRFCEAAYRLLEQITKGKFTPLGKQLDTQKLTNQLENLVGFNDSVRMHIPRSLRVVYDIRNKRDTAHLADGIDPNVQDSTLVVGVIDWVLAEFIRMYHSTVSPGEAQSMVQDIVTRLSPIVQDFGGFLKVLDPSLRAGDFCLVLLYHRGTKGATFDELITWARPPMRSNLRSTLTRLVDDKALLHFDGTNYIITQTGQQEVETRKLLTPL
jgi:hypothetical protein